MATTITQTRETEEASQALTEALARLTVRLRLRRWVCHASRGALAGVALCFVFVLLAHFDFLPDRLPLEADLPLILLLAIGVGTITAFARPIAPMEAARLAESRLGLKERLSSALEFSHASSESVSPDIASLLRLQRDDAALHARSLQPREAVPLPLPWEAKAALAGLILLLAAQFLPALPLFVPPALRTERLIVAKSGQKLETTARLIQKQAESLHLDGTRRAALNMQKLGRKMAAGRMDKKQAMVQMSKLTQQIKADQMKMAQANSGVGLGSQSLSQAGQQFAKALQSAAAQSAAAKSGSGGGNGGQKNGQGGGQSGKNNDPNKFNGFNAPGSAGHKGSSASSQNSGSPATPEMQKAAQAMQQNNPQGLSDQLRQLASRVESGQMSAGEQAQAAQDLGKLSDALKNAGMPETQKHAQAAADALKRGDRATAASEMRKAADAAEREQQQQQDQQGMQQSEDATQGSEGAMADANSPGDIGDSQQGSGNELGNTPGQGQGSELGQGEGDGQGSGQNLPGAHGKHGSGKGNGGSGGGGMPGGKPADTGQGSTPTRAFGSHVDPSKNPKYARLYLGKPSRTFSGPSMNGPMRKLTGTPGPGQSAPSTVPYYNYAAPAAKSAESAMDKEDIPPSYRSDVRKYFNSLQPTTKP